MKVQGLGFDSEETSALHCFWSVSSGLCVSIVNETFQETHKTFGSNPSRQ